MRAPANGWRQMQRVDPTHQRQIRDRDQRRLVGGRRARQPEELTLPNDRQGMGSGDHRVMLRKAALMSGTF